MSGSLSNPPDEHARLDDLLDAVDATLSEQSRTAETYGNRMVAAEFVGTLRTLRMTLPPRLLDLPCRVRPRCETCRGTGHVPIELEHGRFYHCIACGGTGRAS